MEIKSKIISFIIIVMILTISYSYYVIVSNDCGQVGFYRDIYFTEVDKMSSITEKLNLDNNILHTESLYGEYENIPIVAIQDKYQIFHTKNVLYGEILVNSSEVVLSESVAYTYFGAVDVVGQTVLLNSKKYLVVGVIADEKNIKKFLNSGKGNIFVSYEENESFDFEYGKIEIYKSKDEIGLSYYDYLIDSDDKIDFLSMGKSQVQNTYIVILPLLLTLLIISINRTYSEMKELAEEYVRQLQSYYFKRSLYFTLISNKKRVTKIMMLLFCVLCLSLALLRNIYIPDAYIPSKLYQIEEYVISFRLALLNLIKPCFNHYSYENNLLILHICTWMTLIGFFYTLTLSFRIYKFHKKNKLT